MAWQVTVIQNAKQMTSQISLVCKMSELSTFDPYYFDSNDNKSAAHSQNEALGSAGDASNLALLSALTTKPENGNDDSQVVSAYREERSVVGRHGSEGERRGDEYVINGRRHICLGRSCEASGAHEAALAHYKAGIQVLLDGAKEDPEEWRRDAVKIKTIKYLHHAEKLCQLYFPNKVNQLVYMDRTCCVCCNPAELRNYKVLGVLDRVTLVMDVMDSSTYIMKVLLKSSGSSYKCLSKHIIPSQVPHMVKLYKYYIKRDTILLLLEHAQGGKLWTYVSSYLHGGKSSLTADVTTPGTSNNGLTGSAVTNPAAGEPAAGQDVDPLGGLAVASSSLRDAAGDVDDDVFSNNVRSNGSECSPLTDDINSSHTPHHVDSAAAAAEPVRVVSFNVGGGDVEPGEMRQESAAVEPPTLPPPHLVSRVQHDVGEPPQDVGVTSTLSETSRTAGCGLGNKLSPVKEKCGSCSPPPPPAGKLGQYRKPLPRPASSKDVRQQQRALAAGSRRYRTRTLSAVFQKLDLAINPGTADEMAGGEVRIPESCVRVWSAEIGVALSHLHRQGIVCRDLHPDNILLGRRGHVLLSYQSQWDCVHRALSARALDGCYSAPEVCGRDHLNNNNSKGSEVDPSSDWWSLGALTYELLCGASVSSCHPSGINPHTRLHIPAHVSNEATSFLTELLKFNPKERLGSGPMGFDEIKTHAFYSGIEWDRMECEPARRSDS